MTCDNGIELTSALSENPNCPEVHVGEEEARLIRAETAVVLLRFVNEIASGVLDPEQQAALMEKLEVCVAGRLDSKGVMPAWEFMDDLLCKRYAEYAQLRVWATSEDKGSLLYKYSKKIGAIVNLRDREDGLFNATLANLLLRSLERWELKELLSGSSQEVG